MDERGRLGEELVSYLIETKKGSRGELAILNAKQIGGIYDLTTSSLLYGIVNSYTLPGKPFIGILFEALKLWYKGAKFKYINSSKEHKTTSAK